MTSVLLAFAGAFAAGTADLPAPATSLPLTPPTAAPTTAAPTTAAPTSAAPSWPPPGPPTMLPESPPPSAPLLPADSLPTSSAPTLAQAGLAAAAACEPRPTSIIQATPQAAELNDGPGSYANGVSCAWTIEASEASAVLSLTFVEFRTESNYDFLKVYDSLYSYGLYSYGQLRLCQGLRRPI